MHTRVMLKEATPEALIKLADEVFYAGELLGTAKPDVISYSCASSAIMKGAEYEASIVERIADNTGAKGTSMVRSVAEALNFLEVKKLVIVAPYLLMVMEVCCPGKGSFSRVERFWVQRSGLKNPKQFVSNGSCFHCGYKALSPNGLFRVFRILI